MSTNATQILTDAGIAPVAKYSLSDPGAAQYDYYKDLFASDKPISDNLTNLLLLGKEKGTDDPMFLQTLTLLSTDPYVDPATQTVAKRELELVNTKRAADGKSVIQVAGAVPVKAPTLTVQQPTSPKSPTYLGGSSFNTVGSAADVAATATLTSAGYLKSNSSYTTAQKNAALAQYNTDLKNTYNTAVAKYKTDTVTYTAAKTKYDSDLATYTTEQAALKPIKDAADISLSAADKQAQDLEASLQDQIAAKEKAKRTEIFRATLAGLSSKFFKAPTQVVTPSVVLAKTKLGGT